MPRSSIPLVNIGKGEIEVYDDLNATRLLKQYPTVYRLYEPGEELKPQEEELPQVVKNEHARMEEELKAKKKEKKSELVESIEPSQDTATEVEETTEDTPEEQKPDETTEPNPESPEDDEPQADKPGEDEKPAKKKGKGNGKKSK